MKRVNAVIYLWLADATVSEAAELDALCFAYAERFCWDVVGTITDSVTNNEPAVGKLSPERPGLDNALTFLQDGRASVLLTASENMLGDDAEAQYAVHYAVEGCDGFVHVVES